MPYEVGSDKLPANVKKLSARKQRQWVHVFNGALENGDSESTAFAKANGVAGRKEGSLAVYDDKGYVYSYDLDIRRVDQAEAAYDPYGAKDGAGCANCQWFVSPNSCVLVSGDIAETGKSKFYLRQVEYLSKPIDVFVVNKEAPVGADADKADGSKALPISLWERPLSSGTTNLRSWLTDKIGSLFGGSKQDEIEVFVLFKDAESGRLRFRTVWTNIFIDKAAEIFSEKAHKEYVEWVDKSGIYPELQIWHCGPGSALGEVDFVDYVDGFCVASGLIHQDKENLALKLAEQPLGVSHGFIGIKSKEASGQKFYDWYRPFEISLLPRGKEANPWTAVSFDEREYTMGFAPAKKQLLNQLGVPEAEVGNWEKQLEESAAKLKAAGISWKEDETEATAAAAATEAAANEQVTQLAAGLKQVNSDSVRIAQALGELAGQVKSLSDDFKKSIDDRVAEQFTARNGGAAAAAGAHVASQSAGNLVDRKEAGVKEGEDWFGSQVIDGLLAGVQTPAGGLNVGVVNAS